jgi:flagellar hook-length control protein FliK
VANLATALPRPSSSDHAHAPHSQEISEKKSLAGKAIAKSDPKAQTKDAKADEHDFDAKLSQAMKPDEAITAKASSPNEKIAKDPKQAASEKEAKLKAQASLAAMIAGVQVKTELPTVAVKGNAEAGEKGDGKNLAKDAKGNPITLVAGKASATGKIAAKTAVTPAAQAAADAQAAKLNQILAQMEATDAAQIDQSAMKSALNGANHADKSAEDIQQAFATPGGAAMLSAAGLDLDALSEKHHFQIEGVKTDAAGEKNVGVKGEQPKMAASPLTTSDFLNLRTKMQEVKNPPSNFQLNPDAVSQPQNLFSREAAVPFGAAALKKDGKKAANDVPGVNTPAGAAPFSVERHTGKTIDAPVTTGAGNKTILAHDTIHQLTQTVNLLSQARQDGEIKIRLRPDHLGELQMKVRTEGSQVHLEVKAQNGESKAIIEQSLSTLRESLAEQGLTLGRVDVVSQPTNTQQSSLDGNQQFDQSMARQNLDSNAGQSSPGDRGSRQERSFEDEGSRSNLVRLGAMAAAQRSARPSSIQGLDLIA